MTGQLADNLQHPLKHFTAFWLMYKTLEAQYLLVTGDTHNNRSIEDALHVTADRFADSAVRRTAN